MLSPVSLPNVHMGVSQVVARHLICRDIKYINIINPASDLPGYDVKGSTDNPDPSGPG